MLSYCAQCSLKFYENIYKMSYWWVFSKGFTFEQGFVCFQKHFLCFRSLYYSRRPFSAEVFTDFLYFLSLQMSFYMWIIHKTQNCCLFALNLFGRISIIQFLWEVDVSTEKEVLNFQKVCKSEFREYFKWHQPTA